MANRLATASKDGTIRVWNVATGECVNVLAAHTGGVYTVVFDATAPDQRMISGGADNTARVWLANKQQLVLGQLQRRHRCPA